MLALSLFGCGSAGGGESSAASDPGPAGSSAAGAPPAAVEPSAAGGGGQPATSVGGAGSGAAGTRAAAGTSGALGRAGSDSTQAGAGGSAGDAAPAGTGGAASAGTADAGVAGADAAVGGRAPAYATSFEAASLEEAGFEQAATDCSGDGNALLDSSSAHTGMQSLRIQASGGFCNHVFARPKTLTGALPAPLYGRVFVKLQTPLAAGHTTFLAMQDLADDKALRLGGQNEVLVWNRESDDATLPELSPTGVMLSAAIPAGEWHCLEWFVDGAAREIKTWLDDRELPGLTLDAEPTPDVDTQWQRKADWSPQLNDLRLGWESYGDQANTLWFDDLAVDAARVGCAGP